MFYFLTPNKLIFFFTIKVSAVIIISAIPDLQALMKSSQKVVGQEMPILLMHPKVKYISSTEEKKKKIFSSFI